MRASPLLLLAALLVTPPAAASADMHAISMHGSPALPEDYAHLPYANPDAPEGGRIVFGAVGGFDSLNPYLPLGRAPWEVRAHTVESLLGRNWDEPFALYGLLARTVDTPLDRSWVEFELRPEARFSDGTQVTVADVIWSMRMLAEVGRPNFRTVWETVTPRQTAPLKVRFDFSEPNREAPLILGLAPILSSAQWAEKPFGEPSLEPLIGSGPYIVDAFEPDRFLSLRRDPAYWGRHLPFNVGRNNLDEIRVEYFRDGSALFEALRAGEINFFREADIARWRSGAVDADDRLRRAVIPHSRPTGMYGFVFNTRRAPFQDIRVRKALTLAFDFEWVNATMLDEGFERIESYFHNSELAHEGAAEGLEREILAPFADSLPEGALDEEYAPPVSEGSGRDVRNLRRAQQLLQEAGWTVTDGVLRDAGGAPFSFEILLGSSRDERIAGVYRDALRVLGVEATVRLVDSAQYQARLNAYSYDMIVNRWGLSLSPGTEQRFYWGSDGVDTSGTRNYMGVDSPAIDAAIDALLSARRRQDYVDATRALDRALSHGVYVVPFWHSPVSRIYHDAALRYPLRLPLYGDWIGWTPDVWWRAEE